MAPAITPAIASHVFALTAQSAATTIVLGNGADHAADYGARDGPACAARYKSTDQCAAKEAAQGVGGSFGWRQRHARKSHDGADPKD